MNRDKLLKILQEETDGFTEQSRLRDDVLDAFEKGLKEALTLYVVMSRLPESDEIRQQAQQMDEKEFDQWWWETVYKAN
mgnify:CR=1 FL=1